jgi:hypothetical protein
MLIAEPEPLDRGLGLLERLFLDMIRSLPSRRANRQDESYGA